MTAYIGTSGFYYDNWEGNFYPEGLSKKDWLLLQPKELEEWSEKTRNLRPQRIFIYFNNDYEAHAIKNAQTLFQLLTN